MRIISKNPGPKIDYIVNDGELTLGNKIKINLSQYEKDYAVHIDICTNENSALIVGIGEKYVAQVDISARKYTFPKPDNNEEAEPSKTALPFDMEQVTLTLWNMED
jgi:hypothetical protein